MFSQSRSLTYHDKLYMVIDNLRESEIIDSGFKDFTDGFFKGSKTHVSIMNFLFIAFVVNWV